MGKPEKPISKEQLEQLYTKEGRSVRELAAFFGCNVSTIVRHLHRKGIRVRSHSETMRGRKLSKDHREQVVKNLRHDKGELNPAWVGGRSLRNGYITIRVGGKYILEHRYIMEQHLGYKLKPFEEVHHINGNILDNRLENLQVWTKRMHTTIHQTPERRKLVSEKMKQARKQRFWSSGKKRSLPE